ncbi:hypothetical protein GCM10028784_11550 [Myceligenerans cantabricum]
MSAHDAGADRVHQAGADHTVSRDGTATTPQDGAGARRDGVAAGRGGVGPAGDGEGWRGDEVSGWSGGVMAALRVLTRCVEVNLLVVLGTLAGGGLLGLGPALRAGSEVLHNPNLAMEPWRGFWHAWRTGWRRSNVLFAPFWLVGALLWADAAVVGQVPTGAAHAVMLVGLTLVGAWTAVVLAWWPRVVLTHDDAAPAVWRYLLLTPLLAPGVALAVLVTLAATAAVILGVPLVTLLAGVSFPLWATGKVVDGRLGHGPVAVGPSR